MRQFLAQQLRPTPLNEEGIRGIGPLGLENEDLTTSGIAERFDDVLSVIVGVMTAGAVIWFVFQFIIGAYGWMSAGGDQKAIEAARVKIVNAVIGMVIVFVALVLISVIGFLLGINILNIGDFIKNRAGIGK